MNREENAFEFDALSVDVAISDLTLLDLSNVPFTNKALAVLLYTLFPWVPYQNILASKLLSFNDELIVYVTLGKA